ncbi:MAG: acyl-ACP--UDP-N-acetylglucosamine O-acyltransferase [Bacteriovoracaceae bacterium]|nr:acyl-ACP--UDP-N-acetylglucosamine O-acyltransferase [Bacteriovoracaceae bacterium]
MSENSYSTSELIHPTAIISNEAIIGQGVKVGPYSIIGPHVEVGDGCNLHSHVVIAEHTKIGKNNEFYQFSSIGAAPQDYTYKGEPTRLEIGDNNIFRECTTINRGTLKQDGVTIIGNNSLIMEYVHFGHDVVMGDFCTISNATQIAGHAKIADRVVIGGGTVISQFCSIGKGCFIGGGSALDRDVPAFCTAVGNRARLKGVNIIGMRRQNYKRDIISGVVDFLRTMESSGLSPLAFINNEETMREYQDNEVIVEMVSDIRNSKIGIAPFVT